MAYPPSLKEKAITLRKKGYSLKELSKKLNIAKSTASLWASEILLNKKAEQRLFSVIKRGQFISAQKKHATVLARQEQYIKEAREEIKNEPDYDKIICAMMYWCEGAKSTKSLAFTNSDPKVIKMFLRLLRKSFPVNEKKFRPCIHLHGYHNPQKQLDFWSKVTDINKKQFIKPYQKSNTGKRIRKDYQGCIGIRYYDCDLARRLMAVAKAYLD